MITIKSKKAGFRRCGVAHPAVATSYPDKQFTKAELSLLQADPMLTVTVVTAHAGGADDDTEKTADPNAKGKAKK